MNTKCKKMIAVVTCLTIAVAVAIPLIVPNTAAAKWFSWTQVLSVKAIKGENENNSNGDMPETVSDISVNEAVVTANNGKPERIEILEVDAKPAVKVEVDKKASEQMQQQVERGEYRWMLNPLDVVRHNADKYGFSAQDSYTLLSQVYKGQSGTGEAAVLVGHSSKYYRVHLVQPSGAGANKIWVINGVEPVKVVVNNTDKRPDVGPGVEGLDYTKVIRWQQNVDEGRELWRLDPIQVARNEGKEYGFTDQAVFTVIKRVSSSSIARHGQIDIRVEQNGKTYTMILVRPFGSDNGAIWTVYSVTGVEKPGKPATSKILFETSKYTGWNWNKGQYPTDMAFATIVDLAAQRKYDDRIPEYVLERVKDIDYDKNVVLFAYLGTGPSGGYGIGIEKVTLTGNNITVQVKTKSPAPGEIVTMMVSHPSDYVTIDRKIVDIWGGVNVTFIDQNGKVLSKNKITINHHR